MLGRWYLASNSVIQQTASRVQSLDHPTLILILVFRCAKTLFRHQPYAGASNGDPRVCVTATR